MFCVIDRISSTCNLLSKEKKNCLWKWDWEKLEDLDFYFESLM